MTILVSNHNNKQYKRCFLMCILFVLVVYVYALWYDESFFTVTKHQSDIYSKIFIQSDFLMSVLTINVYFCWVLCFYCLFGCQMKAHRTVCHVTKLKEREN